jgi:ADP-heptose:LPS heptosyltransferase
MTTLTDDWLHARRILAVRLDNIGDVVMLGPALRAVKETSPDARVTLLASRGGSAAVPLIPWIDNVITWKPVWQDIGGDTPFEPARERQLIDHIAAGDFDAALIFTSFSQTPHVPGYVCYLAGIRLRAGESKEFGGATLTTELKGAPDDLHQVERNLRLVEHLGFIARDRRLVISTSDAARFSVSALLARADVQQPFVLLHPGASARARRYPAERFAIVADRLRAHGIPVVITGTERERDLVATITARVPRVPTFLDQTTLTEYAALVERAAVVICNNTLPMHLADAVETPVVVLYSGTDLESQWRPRRTSAVLLRTETPCHPCYLFDCPIGQPCLDISPDEVVGAVFRLLAQRSLVPIPMEAATHAGR